MEEEEEDAFDEDFLNDTLPIGESDHVNDNFNLSSDSVFFPAGSSASLVVSSPRKNISNQKSRKGRKGTSASARNALFQEALRCPVCDKAYKTSTGLKNHVANHKFEGALSRLPSSAEVRGFVVRESAEIGRSMVFIPTSDEDETGLDFVSFASEIAKELSPPSTDFAEFATSVSSVIESIPNKVKQKRNLLRNSIMTAVRTTTHDCLAVETQREILKAALCKVIKKSVAPGIPELYLQEFSRQMNHSVVKFLVDCMRNTSFDSHAVSAAKKTPEEYGSLFDRQSLHYVLGASVRSLLRRCRQYANNSRYQQFQTTILERMTTADTGVANPKTSSYWTQLLNRKSLIFVNEKTVSFFSEVAKIICYSETENGCLYRDDILSTVFSSPSLLTQWEGVVGGSLSEDLSFDLLRMLVLSLCGTFGKGILLRRINNLADRKIARPVAVGIRAKVTR